MQEGQPVVVVQLRHALDALRAGHWPGFGNLARRHADTPVQGIHAAGSVHVKAELAGRQSAAAYCAVRVGFHHHHGRAENSQLTIEHVNLVIKVGTCEHADHAFIAVMQPLLDRLVVGQRFILQSQAEPGPCRAGQPALHAAGQGAHGQNADVILQVIAHIAVIGRLPGVKKTGAARHEVPGQVAPMRFPASLALRLKGRKPAPQVPDKFRTLQLFARSFSLRVFVFCHARIHCRTLLSQQLFAAGLGLT